MESWSSRYLLTVAIFCSQLVQLSVGVKCYSCSWLNDMGDKACLRSPPPKRFLLDCNQPQCLKRYSFAKGKQFIERFCVAQANDINACSRTTVYDEKAGEYLPGEICYCNTSGCNGAPSSSAFTTLSRLHGILQSSTFATITLYFSTCFG